MIWICTHFIKDTRSAKTLIMKKISTSVFFQKDSPANVLLPKRKTKKCYVLFLLVALLEFPNHFSSQIVQRGNAVTAASTTNTISIAKPAGLVAGDMMIANITSSDNNSLNNRDANLAGWTLIDGHNLNNNQKRGSVLYKIATGSEPLNYLFNVSNFSGTTDNTIGGVIAFSGVNTVNPFDVPPATLNGTNSNAASALSITTLIANSAVIMLGMVENNRSWSNWITANPGGLTELYDFSNLISIGAAWLIKPTAGSTGNGTATLSGNGAAASILIALRPSVPPTISNLSATNGCVGSSLIITGTNFSGATSVSIGGIAATITGITATTVTVTVGAGTTGPVHVITPNGSVTSSISFTVNPLPAAPENPTGNSPQCNPPGVTLTRTGVPPTGVTWYWQTVSNGVSTVNSGVTYNATTSMTYYLRARNNTTGCWSAGSGSIAVVITPTLNTVAGMPNPGNAATGICYSGTGAISAVSWGAVTGANSYDVYFGAGSLPSTVTANITAVSYPTGPLLPNTTYYWKVVPRNACGITTGTTATWSFTTSGVACYCTSTSWKPSGLYINSVAFVGTLTDPPVNTSTFSANGYQNFTGLPIKAVQAQGEGINIIVHSTGDNFLRGTWKAWVDWNRNGIFQPATEEVYNIYGYVGSDATFGFVIPPATVPGNYRIRIKVNNGTAFQRVETYGFDFSPCDNFEDGFFVSNYGETEDYLFTVTAKCNAIISTKTDGSRCGAGNVTLGATASAGVTEFRWYTTPSGGSYTTSSANGSATTFTTPSLSATTNYYVTAWNGSCESQVRTLVIAKINPSPIVSFAPANPIICGENTILKLTAGGDKETVYLINEDFETGGLGVFVNVNNDANTAIIDTNTSWQNRTSTFVPTTTNVWFPAVSSGFGNNKFALASSDSEDPNFPTSTVENSITQANGISSNTFLNLTLKLRLFYSRYFPDGYVNPTEEEYVNIELSTDGGITYPTVLQSFTSDVGSSTKFAELTYNISAYINQPNLKIRVRHRSFAGNGWLPDGIAIDDVELFGEKPLNTSFNYNTSVVDAFTDSAATVPYTSGTPATTIWLKPSAAQLQNASSFNIPVTSTLSNGCIASGSVVITNNSKIWDTSSTDWNASNWKPNNSVPTADKCVVIKKPIVLSSGADGFAKNITIETGGSLAINTGKALTVTDEIINKAGSADFIVASDANLLQLSDTAVNTGNVTVKRNAHLKRLDYNYWASPVSGQNLKVFSPGTLNNRFYTYNESNDFFEVIDPLVTNFNDNGKGYAIRAFNTYGTVLQTFVGNFIGVPNNGVKNLTLNFTDAEHGYNLIGNPYSSNIDFYTLYANNSTLIYNTAYFWTNVNPNPAMQGSNYPGTGYFNNYAVLNGTGGVSATSSGAEGMGSATPNQFVKVGQGFIVKSKAAGTLSFSNGIRTKNNTGTFFNKDVGNETDRFWLNLTTPLGVITTQLIGYLPEATNDFELDYDAPLMILGADAFYSVLSDQQLAIQGRASFLSSDVVSLGTSHYDAGNYTISLGNKEGIFAKGQNIYLKDKETGILTNLTVGLYYKFNAKKGLSEGRFDIVYVPQIILGTDGHAKDDLIVYRDADDFVVKSRRFIYDIEVYDVSGKLLMKLQPQQKEVRVDAAKWIEGIYILKIIREGDNVTRKVRK